MTQGRGYSVVEMLVAVALLAVLAGYGVPAFSDMLQRNRVTASANLLLTHIQMARMRAVMDSATVVICPSQDGETCMPGDEQWSQGWLMFKDASYRTPPSLDSGDTLLLVHRNDTATATVRANLTHIRYSPSGSASNGTITVCGAQGARDARAIIVNIVGRARVSRTNASGGKLSCDATP